jgi:hypothetical protein
VPLITDDDLPSTTGELRLVVAWASGKQSVARFVKTGGDVITELRSHAQTAVEDLTNGAPHTPDTDLETTATWRQIQKSDSTPVCSTNCARARRCPWPRRTSSSPNRCSAMPCRSGPNPIRCSSSGSALQFSLRRSRRGAALVTDTLNRFESPIFAFDNRYDVIVTNTKVYVLNKTAFEGLFKDSDAVLAKTGEWVKEVAKTVGMTPDSSTALETALKQNRFLHRKFLAIKDRPHIQTMTPKALRAEITRLGHDVAELMEGDLLKVTDANVKLVLQVLNEDLFSGGFSEQHYAASSKRTV